MMHLLNSLLAGLIAALASLLALCTYACFRYPDDRTLSVERVVTILHGYAVFSIGLGTGVSLCRLI